MRKIFLILVLGALMACLVPASAQTAQRVTQPSQEWKTATMQGSGSAYSSNVTAVGATTVMTNSGTVSNPFGGAPTTSGPHRSIEYNEEFDEGDPGSPIGDAMLPLLTLACVYVIYRAARVYRRKRETVKE